MSASRFDRHSHTWSALAAISRFTLSGWIVAQIRRSKSILVSIERREFKLFNHINIVLIFSTRHDQDGCKSSHCFSIRISLDL